MNAIAMLHFNVTKLDMLHISRGLYKDGYVVLEMNTGILEYQFPSSYSYYRLNKSRAHYILNIPSILWCFRTLNPYAIGFKSGKNHIINKLRSYR